MRNKPLSFEYNPNPSNIVVSCWICQVLKPGQGLLKIYVKLPDTQNRFEMLNLCDDCRLELCGILSAAAEANVNVADIHCP